MAAAVGPDLFVLGGLDRAGVTVSAITRLDPATGKVTRFGTLAAPTHGGAAAVLGGRILVFGGASTSVHDLVQAVDPATGKTTVVGHLPAPRADVAAAVVDRKVVLLGGFDGFGPLGSVLVSSGARGSISSLSFRNRCVIRP